MVPYTRGAEWSRPRPRPSWPRPSGLADQGVREVTLLGQNVNAYDGGRRAPWPSLVRRKLAKIPGLDRIRYTTSHPRDMGDDLIEAHAELAELMPYLHLPVQAGSDKILQGHEPPARRPSSYLRLVETHPRRAARHGPVRRLHRRLPRRDATKRLRGHARAGPRGRLRRRPSRSSTPAAPAPRPRPCPARWPRRSRPSAWPACSALLDEQQKAFNAAEVGQVLPVLFEKARPPPGQIVGRSPYLQAVYADGPRPMGPSIRPDRFRPRRNVGGNAGSLGARCSSRPDSIPPGSEAA